MTLNKHYKIKKSYGLICYKKDKTKGLQIILVKKPVTYHFCEFVSGKYKKNDDSHILKLFNNMTYGEKMDILSMKFSTMWYRAYKSDPEHGISSSNMGFVTSFKKYSKLKLWFEDAFLSDQGLRLNRLINNTVNAETIWEIPKGRKSLHLIEDDISTAIREFHEETLISPNEYSLSFNIKPYIETYSDFGTVYKNKYYFCEIINDLTLGIKFSNRQQINEISDIKWCNLTDLSNMKLDKTTHFRIINAYKKISKKIKNKF